MHPTLPHRHNTGSGKVRNPLIGKRIQYGQGLVNNQPKERPHLAAVLKALKKPKRRVAKKAKPPKPEKVDRGTDPDPPLQAYGQLPIWYPGVKEVLERYPYCRSIPWNDYVNRISWQ